VGTPTLLACAWLVGRVLSDRYPWSQPISWIPPVLLAAPVWAAVLISWRRSVCRRRRARASGRRPARRFSLLRAAGVAFGVVSLAHLAFVELGVHRVLRPTPAGGGGGVRVIFWNQAGQEFGDISPTFLALDPTVFVLANRHSSTSTRDLAQAFIDTGEAHAAVGWPFDLFGRLPITRWASASLGLEGRSRLIDGSKRDDPGWAAWFELDSPAGPLILWAIDLPSDPELARYPLAKSAGESIAAWQGAVRYVDGEEHHFERADTPGFPPPDIIVGDFNIPRGSASLDAFLDAAGAEGMHNAFDLAGVGWRRTWPRERPVWAIDQCFVSDRLQARSLATPDPGFGGHRVLVVDLALP